MLSVTSPRGRAPAKSGRAKYIGRVFAGRSLKLATLFGIRIGVSTSWFVILFLLLYFFTERFRDTQGVEVSTAFLLAAVAAVQEGWRVTYLGADLPAADIATAATIRGARVVLLSAVLEADPDALSTEVREIRAAVRKHVTLFVGGPGAQAAAGPLRQAGAVPLRDLDELRAALNDLHPGGA